MSLPAWRVSAYSRDGRAPVPDSAIRSYNMSCIGPKNTTPELLFRRELRGQGIAGYRLHPKALPGRPDIYFPLSKVGIFINGCFWHRCSYCKPSMPKTHKAFWSKKFAANVARDKRKRAELKKLDIKSVVFWECQIRKNAPKLVVRLRKVLSSRKKVSGRSAV